MAVCKLPPDCEQVFRLKNRNDNDDNCVITNYYQHGPCNVHQYVMMQLLMVQHFIIIVIIGRLDFS